MAVAIAREALSRNTRQLLRHPGRGDRLATRWNVLVSALEASTAQPEVVVRQLESTWRSATPAAFTVLPAAELATAEFRTVDAVVLLADRGASQSVVLPLLENLEEAGVPVLALLNDR